MNALHCFPVRIYYEDTDHGGVVYHANYLRFMERARTEMLRSYGIELDQLQNEHHVLFAVTTAKVNFIKPARFNELLEVHTSIIRYSGARIYFQQNIVREDAPGSYSELTCAEITVASISSQGTVMRIPEKICQLLTAS